VPKLTSTFSGLDLEVSDLMLEIEAVIGFEIVYPDVAEMFKMGKIMPWLELPDRAKFDGFDKAIVAFAMLQAALLVTTPTDCNLALSGSSSQGMILPILNISAIWIHDLEANHCLDLQHQVRHLQIQTGERARQLGHSALAPGVVSLTNASRTTACGTRTCDGPASCRQSQSAGVMTALLRAPFANSLNRILQISQLSMSKPHIAVQSGTRSVSAVCRPPLLPSPVATPTSARVSMSL